MASDPKENLKETSLVHSRPMTMEQMAKRFEIDLSVWEVERLITNVWENVSKDEQKDLTFEDGRIGGKVKSGGVIITPMWQTKVWWIRIKPVALSPILYPVDVSLFNYPISKSRITQGKSPQILVVPDLHAGYVRVGDKLVSMHDKKAVNVIRKISKMWSFTHIIFLGDLLDFAEWSTHFPTPNGLVDTTQKSLVEVAAFIAELRADHPNAKMVYLQGNHEIRMESILVKQVPAAYGLKRIGELDGFPAMSIPGLLQLSDLDVKWIGDYPSGEYWVGGDELRFIHGSLAKKSGLTSAHYVNTEPYSTIFGHIHRVEEATRTIWSGGTKREIFAASPGCLCKIDDKGLVPARNKRNNWQQGAMVLTKHTKNSPWMYEQISIQNGVGYFRGNIITG